MPDEPTNKRTIAFFDGQNLFHHAKAAFGYKHPNYCPLSLATRVCEAKGFNLQRIHFYTGVPSLEDQPLWHHFWSAKLLAMSRQGIITFSRPLRYRRKTFQISDGIEIERTVAEEKGIDVRIAIDVIRMARRNELDVALVFSQDQDFSEVADEIRQIAKDQSRWINITSAFPHSRTESNHRGIQKTDWFKIDRTLYDKCVDARDYRPKRDRR